MRLSFPSLFIPSYRFHKPKQSLFIVNICICVYLIALVPICQLHSESCYLFPKKRSTAKVNSDFESILGYHIFLWEFHYILVSLDHCMSCDRGNICL